MRWEFAALWVEDEAEPQWRWRWRRADDTGTVIEQSAPFASLQLCIADAQVNGFDEADCGPVS